MISIKNVLQSKRGFVSLGAVSSREIACSEEALHVRFSSDYREYIALFGAASYYDHELTGICEAPSIDVVAVTMQEREMNPNISLDWYVIEEAHIDGIVFWQDVYGRIYQSKPGEADTGFQLFGRVYKRIVLVKYVQTK